MTRTQITEQAEDYERKQNEAKAAGDEFAAEFYENKKRACWKMLPYGTEDEDEQDEGD